MGERIVIRYRNHRGEVANRTIHPMSIRFGPTQWHPEPQWLLDAYDVGKGLGRSFAMRDILEWDVAIVEPAPDSRGER